MTDFSWEQLITRIEEGDVVPVVGRDVLQVIANNKKTMLYDYFAMRLATELDVKKVLRASNPLNAVVGTYLENGGELPDVYVRLRRIVRAAAAEIEVPKSLKKLAAIQPFELFVTTTFDPMLELALNKVRFNGARGARPLSFALDRTDDVTDDLLASGTPIIFHLLGRSDAPPFAVTDEDMLEFVHSLQSDTRYPKRLLDELDEKFLLIIGNDFDDWLARFFIRSAKRERIYMARSRSDFVADERVRKGHALRTFLQRFGKSMKIFTTGGPIDFIDALYEKWMEEHGGSASEAPPEGPPPAAATLPAVVPGCIFISYAHDDVALAQEVRARLDNAKFDVWFDSRLTGGSRFASRIQQAIDQCAVFMPLISKQSLTDARRDFRLEWDQALALARKGSPDLPFITPVAIDDTRYKDPRLPDVFNNLTWERLNDEFPRKEFVMQLRETVRRYRLASMGQTA